MKNSKILITIGYIIFAIGILLILFLSAKGFKEVWKDISNFPSGFIIFFIPLLIIEQEWKGFILALFITILGIIVINWYYYYKYVMLRKIKK